MIKKIHLVLINTIIVQCADINSELNLKNQSVSLENKKYVSLKAFDCNSDFLWLSRLDNLKQWKKRRRHCSELNVGSKTDRLRFKRLGNKANESNIDWTDYTAATKKPVSLVAKFKERWPLNIWRQYWFTDDYLMLINSHWLQFDPPHNSINYLLGGIYIVMMVVGCSGNALVLIMYLRCRTLRTPGNILVANLALSDFFMLAKTPVFIFNSFNLGPALGKTGCVIYGFLGGLTGTTSIATLSAIALDRYWAVVRPLEPLQALTAIRARLLAVGTWVYAALFAIIPALDIGYGHYVPEGYLTSCSFDYLTDELPPRYFIFTFFCAAWVAPFCTISFCYLNIFRVVVGNRNVTTKNIEQRLSTRHVKEQVKRKAEIKLAFLVIVVIALFFVSWTPYAVVALLGIAGKKELITPLSSMIPALFCKTAACINPFIYIITHPTFRKEFRKLLYRDKTKRMGGTFKSIGYTTDMTKVHKPSADNISDTEVEVVEMKDIPYQNEEFDRKTQRSVKSISSRLSERQDSQKSISMKSIEENVVGPPSWYAKPQFAKRKSFHRRSLKNNVGTYI